MSKALFEIRRRAHRPNYAMNTPAGADYLRGFPFQEGATAGTAAVADGTGPLIGFVTRPATQTGPTLADSIYPNRLELPFKSGEQASFEYAEEIEAEGSDYVQVTGTGALTAGTALKTPLSFQAGKWAAAQSGQVAEFALVEIMPPVVAGNLRIRAQRLPGAIKA